MDRLQPVFHVDVRFAVEAGDHVQHFIRDTIRPGTDRQADNVLYGEGSPVKGFQLFDTCVGIGKRLKVGDEFPGLVALAQKPFAEIELLFYAKALPRTGASPRAELVAVNTAPRTDAAIPVRTAQARIQADFLDPAAKALPQKRI